MVRRHPEHVAQPGVEVGGALLVVRLVEPETGELGAGVETRLARAQRRFATPALGDVEAEAGEPLGLAVSGPADAPARGDPAHVALAGVTDPVLEADRLAAHPGSCDGFSNGCQVLGIHRRLEAPDVERLVRREAEDRPGPLRGPDGTGRVVESPESRFGRVCRQRQALAALPQVELVAPARERVGEDLGDQLQAPHQRVRPVARCLQGVEGESADRGLTAHRERNRQIRKDAEPDRALAVDRPLGRKRLARRQDHGAAGPDLTLHPGETLLADRLAAPGRLRRDIDVGRRDDRRIQRRPLPEHAEVDAEGLADAAEGVFDLAIHRVGRQIDEARGEIGEQLFEGEQPLEVSRLEGRPPIVVLL